jgi:hypothetical protein
MNLADIAENERRGFDRCFATLDVAQQITRNALETMV